MGQSVSLWIEAQLALSTFDNYMNLKFYLEDLLGRKVDLVEKETLHPSLRSVVERELVEIAAVPTVSRRHIRK